MVDLRAKDEFEDFFCRFGLYVDGWYGKCNHLGASILDFTTSIIVRHKFLLL